MTLLISGAASALGSGRNDSSKASQASVQAVLHQTNRRISAYHKTACHWQALVGRRCAHSSYRPEQVRSVAYARWVLDIWKHRAKSGHLQAKRWMVRRIRVYRKDVNHWQQVLGKSPQRELAASGGIESQFNVWRRRSTSLMDEIRKSVDVKDFTCIHRYEGSWTANTGNGYYGGLQMDLAFQSLYGGYLLETKGTANNWTPLEQIVVAKKAHDSGRGFTPWPNTARICGLI